MINVSMMTRRMKRGKKARTYVEPQNFPHSSKSKVSEISDNETSAAIKPYYPYSNDYSYSEDCPCSNGRQT